MTTKRKIEKEVPATEWGFDKLSLTYDNRATVAHPGIQINCAMADPSDKMVLPMF